MQTVLVTGGSGGIGREISRGFAHLGFRVGVHFHGDADRAAETLGSLEGDGHCLLPGDLTDRHSVKELFDSACAALGSVAVLVNNAGIGERHDFAACDYETWCSAWQRVVNTNLFGAANLAYLAAKHMMAGDGGRIINVSSRGAFVGEPDQPWYGASKAGLNSMGQSLARALAADGVYVFTVAPGFVATKMSADALGGETGDRIRDEIPIRRITTPEEVARAVVFLGTDAPEAMTGAIIDINGASYLRT